MPGLYLNDAEEVKKTEPTPISPPASRRQGHRATDGRTALSAGGFCGAKPTFLRSLSDRPSTRRLGSSLPQAGGESRVLRGVQAALEHVQQRIEIVTHECGRVQPEAGKHRAAQGPIFGRGEPFVPSLMQDEPVDLALEDAPDEVLADTVALVRLEFLVQVVTLAAGGDFGDEIGRSVDVVIRVDLDLTTRLGLDKKNGVGLGHVAQVQAHTGVITELDSGRPRSVKEEPTDQTRVRC